MPTLRTTCCFLWLGLFGNTLAFAAHQGPPAAGKPPAAPAAEQKRGARLGPTHSPQPQLPPIEALAHVRTGHAAWRGAQRTGTASPPPAPRPSGAGRYVCGVVVCADCDLDVPAMLGLQRADVLLLSVPGPFVDAAATATIVRQVLHERLSLVLVFTHVGCTTLTPLQPLPANDVLAIRVEQARKDAARRTMALGKLIAQSQCERLLAASDELAARCAEDTLRILPAEIDPATGNIAWHSRAIDELPLPPVK